MKLSFLPRCASVAGACLLSATPLAAQWSEGGTVNPVPMKADGTVDVDAPGPKLPNGKPDFSGLWATQGSLNAEDVDLAEENLAKYGVRGKPAEIQFIEGGVSNPPKDQIPYQPWALKLTEERAGRSGADDPASKCLPVGSLIQYHIPPILEIVQKPDRVVLLFESTMTYRQLFMDGRALPTLGEAVPTYNGYSIARWEGDTLVVESMGYNGKIWIDNIGSPTTEQLRVTERWRRPTFGKIEIEMTFDDPGAFTKPYIKRDTLFYEEAPGMMETYCLDENRFIQQTTPDANAAQ